MISLKHYLDLAPRTQKRIDADRSSAPNQALLSAFRGCLIEMAQCGAEVCPDLGPELVHGIARILEAFGPQPAAGIIASSEAGVRELLRRWGKKTSQHYDRKTGEVKDLLLVMARMAESLGHKDERYARQLDAVTSQLESIVHIEDIGTIHASVKDSVRELKDSVARMTAESRAVIDHLRAEVSTYQTKLEKAEHFASRDSLTGLGRHWIENRIAQRIDDGSPFSIVLIHIDGFHQVVESHGNLVGDSPLKEFARELRSTCRFTDIVGRWGGDEFIVVLDQCGPEIEAQVARLKTRIARSYHVPGRTGYMSVRLNVSIGAAVYRPGEYLQDLLERADAELCMHRRPGTIEMSA